MLEGLCIKDIIRRGKGSPPAFHINHRLYTLLTQMLFVCFNYPHLNIPRSSISLGLFGKILREHKPITFIVHAFEARSQQFLFFFFES